MRCSRTSHGSAARPSHRSPSTGASARCAHKKKVCDSEKSLCPLCGWVGGGWVGGWVWVGVGGWVWVPRCCWPGGGLLDLFGGVTLKAYQRRHVVPVLALFLYVSPCVCFFKCTYRRQVFAFRISSFPPSCPPSFSATPPSPVSLTQQGTVPIPGARTLEQAQENLGAMVRTRARNLLHEPTLLLSVPFRLY